MFFHRHLIPFIVHYTINFLSPDLDYFILLGRLISMDPSFLIYKIRIIVILGFKWDSPWNIELSSVWPI